MTAEILSYSRSKGLFAGIDLSGGVLRPDDDANTGVYGAGATPNTILATREMSAPPEAGVVSVGAEGHAGRLRCETQRLSCGARASASGAAGGASDRRRHPRRVVDIQQAVDRMLADTTPAAVGTSGTSGSERSAAARSNVDRARLMQVRQQLDALLATLNRR